jgi:sulfide:quinone oxidoreductase
MLSHVRGRSISGPLVKPEASLVPQAASNRRLDEIKCVGFALGDVTSTPNSKTAVAVRKQAPVVVDNILHMIGKTALVGGYDGDASCPLTTAFGKTILAEFIYGGKVTPTLPLNPAKERWIGWWIKTTGLPLMYWNYMLKGHVWFPKHNTAFKEVAA